MPDQPDDHHPPDATRATPRAERRSAARRVGPYRIDGELGRGGMGIVYRAFDERLHRDVALKALPSELSSDPAERARLEREARAIALVNHAHVGSIFGLEESEGTLYLVLELVEGETLCDRLGRGRLPHDEALALCSQVAAGLTAVHRKGLVHRDLKPSNVMVTPDGVAKLLDFGLARQAREAARGEVTRHGEVMGTPGWMAPEQLRGEELDARTDAFAWGCLLYECLTGAPAFPGASWTDRDAAVLRDEPSWECLPELHPTVAELLKSCLSKDRAGRPATLDEARRVLEGAGLRSTGRRALAALPKHSLPAERDAFVGREAELQELGRLIEAGHRLVSVLGLGGAGKTRLALRFARERLADFPGGAWFCDLSEARSAQGIVSAVATALEVPLGTDDPVSRIGHVIAARGRCLVVLDNFEQVARHARETLGRWLDGAAEACFIVTTREVLGLRGETALALAPLRQDEALELFTARAIQARSDFALTEAERPHVEALVELLDLLPLAIELAAARVRLMPPKTLLQRMSERFKLLTSSGGRHTRQATLRATLDWSWEMLSPDEQQALAQLSVFEGGFTLEAAEAVLALSEAWPADAVQRLLDKSLVCRAGEDRFDLLVSVQEYAAEKLEALGGRDEAEARHGAHFAAAGTDEAVIALDARGGGARRRALELELDNLVAACRRSVSRGDGPTAVATLKAAASVLGFKGPLVAGVDLARSVLGVPGLDPAQRWRVLVTLGDACWRSGFADEARACHEEALSIARATGDRAAEARTLSFLGVVLSRGASAESGLGLLEAGLALSREVGDRRTELASLRNIGNLQLRLGRADEASACFHVAMDLAHELGDLRAVVSVQGSLGNMHGLAGRHAEGLACLEKALPLLREVGDRAQQAHVLSHLGVFLAVVGRNDEGREHSRAALALAREVGERQVEVTVASHLAIMLGREGRLDEARELFESTLALARAAGNRPQQAHLLGNLGHLHGLQGRPDEALRCLQSALEIHRAQGSPRDMGRVLAQIALVHAGAGRARESRDAVAEGEAVLRAAGDRVELALFLCTGGECERLLGDLAAARRYLAEAEAIAQAADAGCGPEVSGAIAELRAALA